MWLVFLVKEVSIGNAIGGAFRGAINGVLGFVSND